MQKTLLIVDDFLPDPYKVRAAALAQEYPEYEELPYFPGRNSKYPQTLTGLDARIEALVGERLKPVQGSSHTKFRLALEGDKGTAGVHIDPAHWSGMLYLSLPEDCSGGTVFYRHKETGTDCAPLTKQACNDMGFASMESLWEDLIWAHTNDASKWEQLFTVPMRFNRLLLFRPHQWHDAGAGFGDSPENGRLIYPLFYESLD